MYSSEPYWNWTLPARAGAPASPPVQIVAVNVTDCPNTDGFADESNFVVVVAFLTVSVSARDLLLR